MDLYHNHHLVITGRCCVTSCIISFYSKFLYDQTLHDFNLYDMISISVPRLQARHKRSLQQIDLSSKSPSPTRPQNFSRGKITFSIFIFIHVFVHLSNQNHHQL